MKKIALAILVLLVILFGVAFVNTLRLKSGAVSAEPAPAMAVDENLVAEHLAGAIRFKTISWQDPAKFDESQFFAFHQYLADTFPKMHAALKKEIVAKYALLYTWPGKDPSAKPILLMAHMDVVPVIEGTEKDWSYPPFDGKIAEGFIWGRGSLDDKVSLMGICEAVERLVSEGYQPKQTVYLAFDFAEEIGGSGAKSTAALLKSRGVKLAYVVDESGSISEGLVPGVKKPVAMIGIAEKGYLSVELLVEGKGGHSSMPPERTTIGTLARAITRLERCPFPPRLDGVTRQMFGSLAPEMPFGYRMLFANTWLFAPVIKHELKKSPETNASIRTTTAPTIINAGVKENVLPITARAVVNFRLLPGDSINYALERIRKTINDPQVKVSVLPNSSEPSPVSDVNSASYRMLRKTILSLFPEAVVTPYLVLGATDSRYYTEVSEQVYKFLPTRMKPEDLKREHGTNERVGVKNYGEIVKFFTQLIRNSDNM